MDRRDFLLSVYLGSAAAAFWYAGANVPLLRATPSSVG
jgi:hypothetical protein